MTKSESYPSPDLKGLKRAFPQEVVEICRVLVQAGFQAVVVGGAVRDALIGRRHDDWDIATSAEPRAVQKLFHKTIPTGLQHGTVTVLVGRGQRRVAVEVTSFRGEGNYQDGRRPESVKFGVTLEEDLARRDFVVNAMAYDPLEDRLIDPFGGRADLRAGVVRAVGVARERFAEDGLRVMRAVRLVAALDFVLEPATEAAIPGALSTLARVSRERVWVELGKLLLADAAERGIEIAHRTRLFTKVAPELAGLDPSQGALLAKCPQDLALRLGVLLCALGTLPASARKLCEQLTVASKDRVRVLRLVEFSVPAWWEGLDEGATRRRLAAVGRAGIEDVIAGLRALSTEENLHIAQRVAAIAARGDPLSTRELALSGGQLMAALALSPGPEIGKLQRYLLAQVLEDPRQNQPEGLRQLACEWLRKRRK